MPKCTLCLTNEADKTGSHVVPHFLMKTVDNADHAKGREKELGFKITEEFVTPYFGRDVNTTKLEKVFGELTDDDIDNARSEIIADHIYCSSCEKKFSNIESAYATTLKPKDDKEPYQSTKSPMMAFLFWTSVVWRVSAYNKLGFKLTPKEESRLRIILDKLLDQEKIDEKDHLMKAMTGDIRYAVVRAPGYADQNATATYFHSSHRFPYCLLIGEFAIFYYMKSAHRNNPEQAFFGLEKALAKAPLISFDTGEYIFPLTPEQMEAAWDKFIEFVNGIRIKGLFRTLDELHVALGGQGKQMHPKDKYEILSEIMAEGKEMGRTFTLPDIVQSTIKILGKNYGFVPED